MYFEQLEELRIRFAYHAPTPEKVTQHETVRENCFALAEYLTAELPESREKSLAITKLEEVMMWSNAAIARRG
jgi:hypothetical protein